MLIVSVSSTSMFGTAPVMSVRNSPVAVSGKTPSVFPFVDPLGPSLILPLVPPREIVGHVGRDLVLEICRALFQKRHHAFFDVLRAAAGVNAAAVDLVRFHGIV